MITFPTTPEEFAAYQRSCVNRELNNNENELIRLSVDILNDCYEKGKAGGQIPWAESEEEQNSIFAEYGTTENLERPNIKQYFAAMLFWTRTAYEQGRREAQT